MKELIRINGNTPIKNFDVVYNNNNDAIIEYIDSLKGTITELENELNRIKKIYSTRILELESSIKNMKSESLQEAEKKFVDGYNVLLSED